MAATSTTTTQTPPRVQPKTGSYTRRKRLFRVAAYTFMVIYAIITLFPFYILFVRTFVSTKDATTLPLWIPQGGDVSMDTEIGNRAVSYNLDLRRVKADMGITGYLNPRQSLR